MTTIYAASPLNKTFIRSHVATQQDRDLIDNEKILLNACQTLIAPPEVGAHEVAVLTAKDTWTTQPDYRGHKGYDLDGIEHTITEINQLPDEAWTTEPPFNLEQAKTEKQNAIRLAYRQSTITPVTDADNRVWSGGFDSAIKLDAAMRLSQAAGATDVTFFDDANDGHVLDLADALAVVITVSSDYQTKLATKQALFKLIETATTEADLNAINW